MRGSGALERKGETRLTVGLRAVVVGVVAAALLLVAGASVAGADGPSRAARGGVQASRGECASAEATHACAKERSCGKTKSVTEGVQAKARVFAYRYSCKKARHLVHIGLSKWPKGWSCTGSDAAGYCYPSHKYKTWQSVRGKRHFRHTFVSR